MPSMSVVFANLVPASIFIHSSLTDSFFDIGDVHIMEFPFERTVSPIDPLLSLFLFSFVGILFKFVVNSEFGI